MKVTISYQVDFDDVPRKVGQLIKNLFDNDYTNLSSSLSDVCHHIGNKQYTIAIHDIDLVRQSLAKIDQNLSDYSNILTGYVKADADLKAGISEPEQISPENIINETEEND